MSLFETPESRFFDLSENHPAEVVPNRRVCGWVFDPKDTYTRVEPHPEFGYIIHVGLGERRPWCLDELQQMLATEYSSHNTGSS